MGFTIYYYKYTYNNFSVQIEAKKATIPFLTFMFRLGNNRHTRPNKSQRIIRRKNLTQLIRLMI